MATNEKQTDQHLTEQCYHSVTGSYDDVKCNGSMENAVEDETSSALRMRTVPGSRDSKIETTMPCTNDTDEVICLIGNEHSASISDISQTASEFPFSTVRVWISSTAIIVLYIAVSITMAPVTSQYLFHRFAQDHYNITISSANSKASCANSTNSEGDAINEAQREASSTILYATIATGIPAFFTCLFAGSISDSLGRKFLLMFSLLGAIVKIVLLCLIIKLDLDILLIYVGSAIDGLCGSFFITALAVTAIIADITPEAQNKAVRFAIIEGIILVCGAISQVTVGYLIQAAGFFIPVLICACLLFVALLITIFLLPETRRNKHVVTWNMATHIKKTFRFYYSDETWKCRRRQFIIGLTTHLTLTFTVLGRSSIEIMFVLNRPICWSSIDIGIFGAVKMVVMSLAAVVLLKMCKNSLSLELTGVICGISSAAGLILEGFSNSTLMLYLSALLGILFTASIPLPKAMLSQIASPSEQGALFSSMSCVETVASMVASTLYVLIYNATLGTFKGAVFMVMAGMCLLSCVFFGIYRCLRLTDQPPYEYLVTDESKNYQSTEDKSKESANISDDINKVIS